MRICEQHALLGDTIEIWRYTLGMSAHGPHPIVEVIDNDKDDVGSLICSSSGKAAQKNQKELGNQV